MFHCNLSNFWFLEWMGTNLFCTGTKNQHNEIIFFSLRLKTSNLNFLCWSFFHSLKLISYLLLQRMLSSKSLKTFHWNYHRKITRISKENCNFVQKKLFTVAWILYCVSWESPLYMWKTLNLMLNGKLAYSKWTTVERGSNSW